MKKNSASTKVGWIETQDKTLMPYYVHGDGFPIFIFNGFSCIQQNLKFLIEGLQSNYKIISWDYKGHGDGQKHFHLDAISLDSFIDDAYRVIQINKINKAVFLGYSMGAQFMFEFHLRYPNIAKGLISLSGITGRVFDTMFNMDLFARILPWIHKRQQKYPERYQKIFHLAFGTPFWLKYEIAKFIAINAKYINKEDIQPFFDQFIDLDPELTIHLAYIMQNHSVLESLHKIKIPTLFLGGNKDLLAPLECSEKAHECMPESELAVISNGTHNAIQEQSDFICKTIIDFINRRLEL